MVMVCNRRSRNPLVLDALIVIFILLSGSPTKHPALLLAQAQQQQQQEQDQNTPLRDGRGGNGDNGDKSFRVCDVLGALELTRFISSRTRHFFQGAIEDVELIRESLSECMINDGIVGGLHNLDEMLQTLDRQARNLTDDGVTTTIDANLAYVDDRQTRRIERYVSLSENQPFIGTKESDMAMVDCVSNVFPWIVDRKSHESKWWTTHQNGRSEGPSKATFEFDQLYVAAWIGSYGEAWMYYPPLHVYGHPLVFSEILGDAYDSHEEEFVKPNLPLYNPTRQAFFTSPYPDTAVPGLSLITAMAPVYYTGQWQGYSFNQTYMASTGVDIAVSSVSTLLAELEGTLTPGSFACLVDIERFRIIVISQSTVSKLYPTHTGMEESRVTYDLTSLDEFGNPAILSDRRNQTPYLVSDTILQHLTNLTNADWKQLQSQTVYKLQKGERGYTQFNITLTNDRDPTLFYVAYERWPNVADDWVLLTFVPIEEVDRAVDVQLSQSAIKLTTSIKSHFVNETSEEEVFTGRQSITLMNQGTLDVSVSIASVPSWINFEEEGDQKKWHIPSNTNWTFPFYVDIEIDKDDVVTTGTVTSLISFLIEDDEYPDCFYSQIKSLSVTLQILPEQELNQLGFVKAVSYVLGGTVVFVSIVCVVWVQQNAKTHMVKASQPIFLHMLCIGTSVMGLSILPLGIDDEVSTHRACSAACMVFPWLFTLGFSISFSALFSKIWRINKIVKAAERFKRMHVEPRDAMIPFFIIFSCNVIVLLVWTLFKPLKFHRVAKNDHESYGTCWFGTGSAVSLTLGIIIAILNFGAVVLANLQAYQARDLKVEYNESKYIGIAMGCILQAFMLGVPLMFLVAENPQAFTFLLSSLIFLIAMSLLVLIFVPKFFFLRMKGNAQVARRNSRAPSSGQMVGSMEISGMFSVTSQTPRQATPSGGDRRVEGLRITSMILQEDDEHQHEKEIKFLRLKVQHLQTKLQDAEDKLREAGIESGPTTLPREESADGVNDADVLRDGPDRNISSISNLSA